MMSAGEQDALYRVFPAVADSVPEARGEVVEFAERMGANQEQLQNIRLATSEALTNVVVHAYRGSPGKISVAAHLAGGELWVLVSDDGGGLRADQESPGLGMGMAIIAQSSDAVTIMSRSSGGTELRMRFDLEDKPPQVDQPRGSSSSTTRPAGPCFSTTM